MNKQEVIKELEDFISFNEADIAKLKKQEPEIADAFIMLMNAVSKEYGSGEDMTKSFEKVSIPSEYRIKTKNELILTFTGRSDVDNNVIKELESKNLFGAVLPNNIANEIQQSTSAIYEGVIMGRSIITTIEPKKTKYRFKNTAEAATQGLAGSWNRKMMNYLLGMPIEFIDGKLPKDAFVVDKTSNDGIVHQLPNNTLKEKWAISPEDIIEVKDSDIQPVPGQEVQDEALVLERKFITKTPGDDYFVESMKVSSNNGYDLTLLNNDTGEKKKMWLSRSGILKMLKGGKSMNGWKVASDAGKGKAADPAKSAGKSIYRIKTLEEMIKAGSVNQNELRPYYWNDSGSMDNLFGYTLNDAEADRYLKGKDRVTLDSGYVIYNSDITQDQLPTQANAPVTLKKTTYRIKTLDEMKRDGIRLDNENKRPFSWNKKMDYLFGKELTASEVQGYLSAKQSVDDFFHIDDSYSIRIDQITSDPLPASSSASNQPIQDEYSTLRVFTENEMKYLYGENRKKWGSPGWVPQMDQYFGVELKNVQKTSIGNFRLAGYSITPKWTTEDKDAVEKLRKLKTQSKTKASANTTIIGNLEVMNEDLGEMNWDDATKAAKDLKNGWRLPTKEELEKVLYPKKNKIPNMENFYWSSTEYNTLVAWYFSFFLGKLNFDSKYNAYYVRAVREISSKSGNSTNSTSTTTGIPETIPPGLITEPNKGDRKSPTASANSVPEGTKAKGNDGYWYTATKTTKGYNQWKLSKK